MNETHIPCNLSKHDNKNKELSDSILTSCQVCKTCGFTVEMCVVISLVCIYIKCLL